MRRSAETNPSPSFRRPILLSVALLCALPLAAQKEPAPPKDDVKLPPKGSEKEIAHLVIKTGSDTADVYLCPKSFLDDMGVTFAKGDAISLTGSKVKQGDPALL